MKRDDVDAISKLIGQIIRGIIKFCAFVLILIWWRELAVICPALPWILLLAAL